MVPEWKNNLLMWTSGFYWCCVDSKQPSHLLWGRRENINVEIVNHQLVDTTALFMLMFVYGDDESISILKLQIINLWIQQLSFHHIINSFTQFIAEKMIGSRLFDINLCKRPAPLAIGNTIFTIMHLIAFLHCVFPLLFSPLCVLIKLLYSEFTNSRRHLQLAIQYLQ